MANAKKYSPLQKIRRSHAKTKSFDAMLVRHLKKLIPILERTNKIDHPLSNRELNYIAVTIDALKTRLSTAATDAKLIRSLPELLKNDPKGMIEKK